MKGMPGIVWVHTLGMAGLWTVINLWWGPRWWVGTIAGLAWGGIAGVILIRHYPSNRV